MIIAAPKLLRHTCYLHLGPRQPCFKLAKIAAVTKQCELAHCHSESTSFGCTIVLGIFSRHATSDVPKSPGSDVG
jgi:hypothetical protein